MKDLGLSSVHLCLPKDCHAHLQDEDSQVLRTGDFEQNSKLSTDTLLDSLATDAKRGEHACSFVNSHWETHHTSFCIRQYKS